MKQKIYITINGNFGTDIVALAICEDGKVLGSHVCSSEGFVSHDMGITGNWKHESYNKYCGEGNWELILALDGKDIPESVFENNKKLGALK